MSQSFKSPFNDMYKKWDGEIKERYPNGVPTPYGVKTAETTAATASDAEKERLANRVKVLELRAKLAEEQRDDLAKRIDGYSNDFMVKRNEAFTTEIRLNALELDKKKLTAKLQNAEAGNAELAAQVKALQERQGDKPWTKELSDFEQKEVEFSRFYANCYDHGTLGHGMRHVINHLAKLLDRRDGLTNNYIRETVEK